MKSSLLRDSRLSQGARFQHKEANPLAAAGSPGQERPWPLPLRLLLKPFPSTRLPRTDCSFLPGGDKGGETPPLSGGVGALGALSADGRRCQHGRTRLQCEEKNKTFVLLDQGQSVWPRSQAPGGMPGPPCACRGGTRTQLLRCRRTAG